MKESRFTEIESKTQTWSIGLQQDLVTLLNHMEHENISTDEFIESVELKVIKIQNQVAEHEEKKRKFNRLWNEIVGSCPDCGSPVRVYPIDTENEEGNKSWFRCSKCRNCNGKYIETDEEEECTYHDFNQETVEEIYASIEKQIG